MRQIVLEGPGHFTAREAPAPEPPAGHALVRVHRVGICGSDMSAYAGKMPFVTYPRVLGHELGVELVSVPAGTGHLKPGDRCAVEPYVSCGRCHPCGLGKPNCCENLTVLGIHADGGMCALFAVPVDRLYKSERLTIDQLALVETLGIGQHAVERAAVRPGESVLVVGAGPIGLAVAQFALAAGGRVRVLDLSETRRTFVRDRLGVEALGSFDGQLAEVVFDATGSARAMEKTFEFVAFGGKLVFVGIVTDKVALDDPLFHRREMTLYASRNSCGAFPAIIRAVEDGRIDTSPWITHRIGLDEVPARFAEVTRAPGVVKAMIEV
jgi:2-desacetyl-2-hydroxyethyl bacteriochlorophyllide A dehydrogenase